MRHGANRKPLYIVIMALPYANMATVSVTVAAQACTPLGPNPSSLLVAITAAARARSVMTISMCPDMCKS